MIVEWFVVYVCRPWLESSILGVVGRKLVVVDVLVLVSNWSSCQLSYWLWKWLSKPQRQQYVVFECLTLKDSYLLMCISNCSNKSVAKWIRSEKMRMLRNDLASKTSVRRQCLDAMQNASKYLQVRSQQKDVVVNGIVRTIELMSKLYVEWQIVVECSQWQLFVVGRIVSDWLEQWQWNCG